MSAEDIAKDMKAKNTDFPPCKDGNGKAIDCQKQEHCLTMTKNEAAIWKSCDDAEKMSSILGFTYNATDYNKIYNMGDEARDDNNTNNDWTKNLNSYEVRFCSGDLCNGNNPSNANIFGMTILTGIGFVMGNRFL